MRKLAALILAGALLFAAAPTRAAFPGKNGKIAFQNFVDTDPDPNTVTGYNEIHIIDADGTGETNLTPTLGTAGDPMWSADGTRIAFMGEHPGILQMNADGGDVRPLITTTLGPFLPSWAPDGHRVAAEVHDIGENYEVYVFDDRSRVAQNLTNNASFDGQPAFSADGTKIAFVSFRPAGCCIYVTSPDGTVVQYIPNTPDSFEPNWSPDGSKIAFMSTRDSTDQNYDEEIYTMNADGTNQVNLTNDPAIDHSPAWSPDGTKIAFIRRRQLDFDQLYVMDADGSNVRRLTDGTTSIGTPDWQPIPEPMLSDFKNVSQYCKALREFLGDKAFRNRYGGGANAFGKCVSSTTH